MMPELDLQQKFVRVMSSAAICGLSISFIIGEVVDQKAKEISHWKIDPHFFPLHYLPIRPAIATAAAFSTEKLQASLVAMNSMPTQPMAPPTLPPFSDSIRVILAAPSSVPDKPEAKKLPDVPVVKQPKVAAIALPPPVATESLPEVRLDPLEISPIVMSLQKVTAELAKGSGKTDADRATVVLGHHIPKELSPPPLPLPQPQPTVVKPTKDEVIEVASAPKSKPTPVKKPPLETTEAALATVVVEKDWTVRGRINLGNNKPEPGHYEVGLFSKIDQDGIPVGYPVVQQILKTGIAEFQLKVPGKIERGYLYGEHVATKTGKRTWIAPPVNPWTKDDRQFADLTFRHDDAVSVVSASASVPSKDSWRVKGVVNTLFARDNNPIPQEDVVVKVRGRKESSRTDKTGSFALDLPKLKGVVYLEFLKAGYHPVLVMVPTNGEGQTVKVDLASRDAIDQIARRLGNRQLSSKGVFLGKVVNADGTPIKGLAIQNAAKADGPFYFTEGGFPAADLKSTSSDGRFLMLNVEPGTSLFETSINGEPVAPFLLSTVEGGEMVMKQLTPVTGSIRGRVFNPVAQNGKLTPLSGSRLRVEGTSEWSNSDSYGAFTIGPIKWMKGERISLEFSAEKFNNHRYILSPDERKDSLNLFAFPANYVGRLAQSMDIDLDPYAGTVMGKVTGTSVRIDALADHSSVNSARDFYFDSKGNLRGSHTMTDAKFGTYVIFNVPKGRTLLQGNDANGVLRYSDSVVISPASISIVMD